MVLLNEADIREVNPQTIGAYAFVLAYNEGISKGLFPRSEPISIEFHPESSFVLRNNTLFVPIGQTKIDLTTFSLGHGHDLGHILTQNIFKHFQLSKTQNKGDVSPGNKERLNFENVKKFYDWFKKKYDYDLSINVPPPEKTLKKPVFMHDLREKLKREIFEESGLKISAKDEFLIRQFFEKLSLYKGYFHNRLQWGKDNQPLIDQGTETITHAIEETIGNVVTDNISILLAKGLPIYPEVVREIFDKLSDIQNTEHPRFDEFKPNVAGGREQIAKEQIAKWKQHFYDILPKFAELYNKKLFILKNTGYGRDYEWLKTGNKYQTKA